MGNKQHTSHEFYFDSVKSISDPCVLLFGLCSYHKAEPFMFWVCLFHIPEPVCRVCYLKHLFHLALRSIRDATRTFRWKWQQPMGVKKVCKYYRVTTKCSNLFGMFSCLLSKRWFPRYHVVVDEDKLALEALRVNNSSAATTSAAFFGRYGHLHNLAFLPFFRATKPSEAVRTWQSVFSAEVPCQSR